MANHRDKHGRFVKGYTPWNKGLDNGWNKGQHLSKEHREKISKALTGIKRSKETKKKISKVQIGRKLKEEHRKKVVRVLLKCLIL